MARIEIYTTQWCSFCARAKALLDAHGLMYEEISLDAHPDFRQRLVELSGRWTVPQIIVDGTPIGGFSELRALERSGDLAA
jgi:glutaredoxin 3